MFRGPWNGSAFSLIKTFANLTTYKVTKTEAKLKADRDEGENEGRMLFGRAADSTLSPSPGV